jgi:DNA-binding XRE family transcriptional regulator
VNSLLFYRKRARMRQFDLAQKLGVTEQMISNFETGRRKPSVSQAVDIARILGCDAAEIFPEIFS